MADLSGNGACFLITESHTIADGLHTVQLYKPLEYAEILTHCRILNGSFLQRGIAGGRSLGDVPDYATLSGLPQDAPVYLVASQDLENQYQSAMPQARFQSMNQKIGPYPIWKLILASRRTRRLRRQSERSAWPDRRTPRHHARCRPA